MSRPSPVSNYRFIAPVFYRSLRERGEDWLSNEDYNLALDTDSASCAPGPLALKTLCSSFCLSGLLGRAQLPHLFRKIAQLLRELEPAAPDPGSGRGKDVGHPGFVENSVFGKRAARSSSVFLQNKNQGFTPSGLLPPPWPGGTKFPLPPLSDRSETLYINFGASGGAWPPGHSGRWRGLRRANELEVGLLRRGYDRLAQAEPLRNTRRVTPLAKEGRKLPEMTE